MIIHADIGIKGRARAVERMLYRYRHMIREVDEYLVGGQGGDVNRWIRGGTGDSTQAQAIRALCLPQHLEECARWVSVIERVLHRYEAQGSDLAYVMRWYFRMDKINNGPDKARVERRNQIMDKLHIGRTRFYEMRQTIGYELALEAAQEGILEIK